MSYTAYTGLEFNKNGKWECLVKDFPEELKKLHYVFGARGNSVPYIDTEDYVSYDEGDLSDEIRKGIYGPFEYTQHFTALPYGLSDDEKKDFVPNEKGGFDRKVCESSYSYSVINIINWNKLFDLREKIFTEIKEKPHRYKTPARALTDLLDNYEDNINAVNVLKQVFTMSTDELKLKGFLDDEYAEDDYKELEYYFFAVQYACDLVLHYCEIYNADKPYEEHIEPEDCRLVLYGA